MPWPHTRRATDANNPANHTAGRRAKRSFRTFESMCHFRKIIVQCRLDRALGNSSENVAGILETSESFENVASSPEAS